MRGRKSGGKYEEKRKVRDERKTVCIVYRLK
jgi:hypothetical protein